MRSRPKFTLMLVAALAALALLCRPAAAATPAPTPTPVGAPLPDLEVLDIVAQDEAPGQVRVVVRFRNAGPAAAPAFDGRFDVAGQEPVRLARIDGLAPGEQRMAEMRFRLGYGTIRFILDDANRVREVDENNNSASVQVFGKPPGRALPLDDGVHRGPGLLRNLLSSR